MDVKEWEIVIRLRETADVDENFNSAETHATELRELIECETDLEVVGDIGVKEV